MFVNGSGSSQGDVYTCNLVEFICHISTQGFLENIPPVFIFFFILPVVWKNKCITITLSGHLTQRLIGCNRLIAVVWNYYNPSS